MKLRVVVLGAGFGGLELSTMLSEVLGDSLDLTLIDKNDSFTFGLRAASVASQELSCNFDIDPQLGNKGHDTRSKRLPVRCADKCDCTALA